MGYYSASKSNEILAPATTRKNLEDMMLSDISQSQKDKYCMIPYKVYRRCRFIETEGGWWVPGVGRERGQGSWCLIGAEGVSEEMKSVLERMVVTAAQ